MVWNLIDRCEFPTLFRGSAVVELLHVAGIQRSAQDVVMIALFAQTGGGRGKTYHTRQPTLIRETTPFLLSLLPSLFFSSSSSSFTTSGILCLVHLVSVPCLSWVVCLSLVPLSWLCSRTTHIIDYILHILYREEKKKPLLPVVLLPPLSSCVRFPLLIFYY